MDNINWNMISALGQWVGSFATFVTVIIALKPYRKKLDIKFTPSRYKDNKATLLILNNSINSKIIKSVKLYNGYPLFNRNLIKKIDYIDYIDDLISEKEIVYIKPNDLKKICFDNTRIIHDYVHGGFDITFNKNLYFVIEDDKCKKYRINSKLKIKEFLEFAKDNSECYKEVNIK
ncbi:hypothetical protein JJB59_09230 [Clostridium perfringens]|uniref:hypothetical protein n=1 Tax=Clostridium perfringens TaxID=1502 RepID=UPI001ABA0631|nr:hypothetical protein [Clostridium perfringens]MBO3391747.1 hypothetical protein [Clostridium perfringens]MBO3423345.1 hypothetical protein [Clostridium perfringens]